MDILYRHRLRNVRMSSLLLQRGDIQTIVRSQNLVWIRPVHSTWVNSLRNPTFGCQLDMRRYQDIGYVHIDSIKGKHMIAKAC
jgi:hypothetical protein